MDGFAISMGVPDTIYSICCFDDMATAKDLVGNKNSI
jgi:hypothetical protein